MAHYAKLDENNKVLEICTIDNENCLLNGIEDEETGRVYLETIYFYSNWKKTSYNTYANTHIQGGTPFRKNYAEINGSYDSARDAFIPIKIFPSWELNEETCLFDAPVSQPTQEQMNSNNPSIGALLWDELNLRWIGVTNDTQLLYSWDPSTSTFSPLT
tara:strand:+ start:37 stop:513 length:477 start_codon:yes stop_codon:yes gene_type:complete